MITIHIEGPSADVIHAELRALLNGEGRSTSPAPVAEQTAAEPAKRPSGRTRATTADKAAAQQNTASGAEERVDPEADKQDAADEAADTAAQKGPDPVKLTHDDVKKVLGAHVQAYGMAASQADVKLLLNNAEKLSAIPDTQKDLAAAIISIADAIEKNPRKHEIAGDGLEKETIAAITPLVQAARAVK
ncbi:hypothetical protein [Bradyrhizobium liaoningense]|uniref:hypothetical protein n=1 Tax=Bradyrhizobium liaoningense TaxID=43992 RepID=UPI0004B9C49B|nr:hypothetical protein [Bradyrhizobium liaoningense]